MKIPLAPLRDLNGEEEQCCVLPLCRIGESFFGAAIHNLLHLRCSLQSGRYLIFFSFQSGMGRTYDSYSLM